MAKKGNDINLFKAASKADKKIQTGVSKNFLGVVAIIVILIAVGAYAGMIMFDLQTVQLDIQEYKSYQNYSTNINLLKNKMILDERYYNQIDNDIKAANKIKEEVLNKSVLYPGLTAAQLEKVLTRNDAENNGCVPEGVLLDEPYHIAISYTNGITGYQVIKTDQNDVESVGVEIFDKGYMVIQFFIEDDSPSIADEYVNNILAKAPEVFAPDIIDEESGILTEASFERGFMSKADGQYIMYIKCRLKSIVQIIQEDQFIKQYCTIKNLSFINQGLTLELVAHTMPIYEVARYLKTFGFFQTIMYTGEEKIPGEDDKIYYSGELILGLTSVNNINSGILGGNQ